NLSIQRTCGSAEIVTSDIFGNRAGILLSGRDWRGHFGHLQGGIWQTPDGVEVEAVLTVLPSLHHHDEDQLLCRVDREERAPASLPVEAADRAWNQAEIRAGADCEAEPPARTESRTDFMSCDVHAGRQRIRRHQPDRFRLQDAHAVKLAAVEQHLAEAQKVRN